MDVQEDPLLEEDDAQVCRLLTHSKGDHAELQQVLKGVYVRGETLHAGLAKLSRWSTGYNIIPC